ncbi:putative amidohydrolase [Maribacter caenipelagi]|uniref:Omega-amidase YafV n=1 Tax=Maribacter caenipelagi TaxID=1447781 RepID=A0A4R7CW64_9FLAO|nr:amidohydrolase [Maribacter caenipelagi]TDS12719.1 putative amidohydrolase [Maribacter caenipelagi]
MMEKHNGRLKIALIQSTLHWEDPYANREMFGTKIDQIDEVVDLIILPEMFTTGFTMSPDNLEKKEGDTALDWMKKMAANNNSAIVGSMVFYDNGNNYNRLFFVKPNGEYETYDKRHTFTLAGEHEKYTAGTERLVIEYKGFAICPLVCYDLRFPVWSRNSENFDVLLYVANWPAPRINAWDALLKARAIENMVYCVGVNRLGEDKVGHQYPGHSSVYDPLGELISISEQEETIIVELVKDEIDLVRNKLRFLNDRDEFNLLN